MKADHLHITNAEMEIMALLWRLETPLTAADIGNLLTEQQWKPTTIHTLAAHLIDKGMVKCYRLEGWNYYVPYISESDYMFITTKDFMDKSYDGNLVEMVRTMLMDMDLTEDTLTALKELVINAELPSVIWEKLSGENTTCEYEADAEDEAESCGEVEKGRKVRTIMSLHKLVILYRLDIRKQSNILNAAYCDSGFFDSA